MTGCVLAGSRINGRLSVDVADILTENGVRVTPEMREVVCKSVDFCDGEECLYRLTAIVEKHPTDGGYELYRVIWRGIDITGGLTAAECDVVLRDAEMRIEGQHE